LGNGNGIGPRAYDIGTVRFPEEGELVELEQIRLHGQFSHLLEKTHLRDSLAKEIKDTIFTNFSYKHLLSIKRAIHDPEF